VQRPLWTVRLFRGTRTCAKEIEGKAASRSPGKDRGEAQGRRHPVVGPRRAHPPTKDGGMQVLDSETPGRIVVHAADWRRLSAFGG
jgi:hypothetical protein